MGILKVTKTIRCTAYYHLYLSKHYAFEMRTQFFDFERLKPVRVTKRNLQEDRRGNLICCMQCGRVISLRTGRGSKKKTPRPTGLFETFQSFFLGAGYPDVDPSPSSKTTVSNFCFFFRRFSRMKPNNMINMKMNLWITTLTTRQLQPINVLHWYTGIGVYCSDCQPCFSGMTILTHSYVWICWNQQNEDPTMNPTAVALRCPRVETHLLPRIGLQ